MATSNSSNYSQNRDQIISDALQLIGVIGFGETPGTNDVTFASSMLNKMIKGWQAIGINLWKEDEATVALVNGQYKYTLSSSSSDRAGTNSYETTLTASSSGTSLTVTSTTGMTAADVIGVQLDAGTTHWTTIVSVDSTTGLTITSGLASVASSGNSVLTYTTHIGRPLLVRNCRYHYQSGLERMMKKLGRTEYDQIPTKTTTSQSSTSYYFSPQLSTAYLYVWPVPNTCADTLHISYIKTLEDFDSASDDPDFPQEWLDVLTCNLAVAVAPAYGLALSKINPDLAQRAGMLLAAVEAWDSEEGSIRILPSDRFDS